MNISSELNIEIIQSTAKLFYDRICNNLKEQSLSEKLELEKDKTSKEKYDYHKEIDKIIYNGADLIELNLVELMKWSSKIPFIGLNIPKNVETSTIDLSISSDISEYGFDESKINEEELLNINSNILLIGQPGAGKTTTIKRILLKYFFNTSEYSNNLPILIRLRNLSVNSTISQTILEMFGIKYRQELIDYESTIQNSNGQFEKIISKKLEYFVGNRTLDFFIPSFLNRTKSILILDGLDELPQEIQKRILIEIENIGLKLLNSKIILTVRKSKIRDLITNFNKYEIEALNEEKIWKISQKWLGIEQGERFYDEIMSKPYSDLANRPVFLTLLMILWTKNRFLPTQPHEVYVDATYLIVKDWDEHRDITRNSMYLDFNPRKKLKFLYEVSYYLTYKVKQKVFSSNLLAEVYTAIHSKYNLPIEEMKEVVSELESSNGIICEAHYNHYEFSHLSIQEYLCAEHILTLPYSHETIKYFFEYPEPLAISICISGDASAWFSNLLLNNNFDIGSNQSKYRNSVYLLIHRLLIETPSFNVSKELGYTVLSVLFNYYYGFKESADHGNVLMQDKEFDELIVKFLYFPKVLESLNLILVDFRLTQLTEKEPLDWFIYLKRKDNKSLNYFINLPIEGGIHKRLFIEENFLSYRKIDDYIEILALRKNYLNE